MLQVKYKKIEDNIATISANKNAEIVKNYVKNLDSSSGNFSQLGLWKLKQELCQTQADPPTAKLDENGTLITSPNLLKKLYVDTYSNCLRNREMKPELLDLFCLKSELWEIRLEELKAIKSKLWTIKDIDQVLKRLKLNKTRDPHGLINDIFRPGVIGNDLKLAMLSLFNEIKTTLQIPKILQFSNITTIWKKKGSRQDLENDRGIFVVSIMRMILDSLIFRDKYEELDINMLNSNGARKDRNVQDHLFVVSQLSTLFLTVKIPLLTFKFTML